MNLKKLLSSTLAATLTASGIAWAATQTLTLGTNTGPGGVIVLFGSTSGSATIQTPAAAGTGTIFQLPPTNGANTNVLQTDGSGNTSWVAVGGGSGALTKILTIDNTTPAASFDFTSGNLTGGNAYLYYRVDCTGVVSATGTPNLIATFNADTTAAHYAWGSTYSQSTGGPGNGGSDSDPSILIAGSVSSTVMIDLWIEFKNIAQTSKHKSINYSATVDNTSSPHSYWASGGGTWLQNTAATEFTVLMSSGSIGGKCTLYGKSS